MKEFIEKVYGLEFHKAKYTLENMKVILELMGNPQFDYKTIHVTGTNGKGSTSNFISSILSQENKVGLFTSPHYFKYNERFKVNGAEISDEDLKQVALEIEGILAKNNLSATFFEFTTLVAFLYFKKQKVDFAVIEVGLGGRLDATNMLEPVACAITSISLDHTNILGKTRLQIAKEKSQIIKANLFTAVKDKEIIDIFKQKNHPVSITSSFEIVKSDFEGQEFKYKNEYYKLKMLGVHQIRNACIAIDLCKSLGINSNLIKKGLYDTKVKGRLDVVSKNPLIIVDGAHNEDGFLSLIEFLGSKGFTLIMGLSEGKDVKSISNIIQDKFERVVVTKSDHKPMPLEEIKRFVDGEFFEKREDALKHALSKSDKIAIAGSLYLIPLIENLVKN
ncbi:MAG: bifunctional folylpolyglutamate synthase/dihydrofolate synthase [Candidatus Woesearchaeota archaeon]